MLFVEMMVVVKQPGSGEREMLSRSIVRHNGQESHFDEAADMRLLNVTDGRPDDGFCQCCQTCMPGSIL